MKRFIHIAGHHFWVLLLLPAFFIIHTTVTNPEIARFGPSFEYWNIYVAAGTLLAYLFNFYFRNWPKAVLMGFLLMCFQFFFAPIYDSLQAGFRGFFFSRYRFIVAVSAILLFLAARYIKKTSAGLNRIFLYLNLLFTLLILTDLFTFCFLNQQDQRPYPAETTVLRPFNGKKPDIYLIVADGYPGKSGLNGYFRFNNDRFSDSLKSLGFYVNDSASSNYNHTTHSMASMLNLSYLREISANGADRKEVNRCIDLVNNNRFTHSLQENGYHVINHSIFPLNGTAAAMNPEFLPTGTTLITRQTFTGRFLKDLVFQLAHNYKVKKLIRYFHEPVIKGNMELPEKTIRIANEKSQSPRFVYTHLIMPHYPYTRDSSGTETDEYRWKDVRDSVLFKSYLKYSNRQLLGLINSLQKLTERKAIIILIGDHGFREFNKPVYDRFQFSCLQAICYPDRKYPTTYQGMSNVNLLRTLLNDQFNQQLPLLKDSSFFLTDPKPGHH